MRAPVLVSLSLATLFIAGPVIAPAVATVVLLAQVLASAADNYVQILFPVPMPRPAATRARRSRAPAAWARRRSAWSR